MRVYGVDFTSAPCRAKPITVAHGRLNQNVLRVDTVEALDSFEAFESFLHSPGPWIAGFDFPFGLPRDALKEFGWLKKSWADTAKHCASLGKPAFAERLNRDRISRPKGSKYRYRAGDKLAKSSPAVRLHQVPVGFMFFEGAHRLARADLHIPVLRENGSSRIALEAYPGYLAKSQLGIKSYKSDEKKKNTAERRENRKRIVKEICAGRPLGIRLDASDSLLERFVEDPTADRLDAAICALQAAWGWTNRRQRFGLPKTMDSYEGWIVTVSEG
jgi:hypothetical protein